MISVKKRWIIYIFALVSLVAVAGILIVVNVNQRKAAASKIYQVAEIETDPKLNGREIKLQAVVFLTSEIDKTQFYVVDLKLADRLNSTECGIYNIPVQYHGAIPKQGSKIEMTGKATGLYSNGTLKFEARLVQLLPTPSDIK
jgi:hypothetical protein